MMKVTVYTRIETISELNRRVEDHSDTSEVPRELFITENAQRTHFQGWIEVQISYDNYERLMDLKETF